MKDYNGYTGDSRNRAQAWLNRQWASGALERPRVCVACGQDHGIIDAHAEDYSEPFRAGVTDGYHLCFVCHMMVHCRGRNGVAWTVYRRFVEEGGRAREAFTTRNFPVFSARFLSAANPMRPGLFAWSEPPARQALLEIELSQDKVRKARRASFGLPETFL